MIKNLQLDSVGQTGTNILSILNAANDLFDQTPKKQLLLLTDGGDSTDFSEEIDFANKHNIQVFIFDVATEKGSSIPTKSGILSDENGNLVIVKNNPNIKKLSERTQGGYLKYSLGGDELSKFINQFKQLSSSKDTSFIQKKQLFYYPLSLALLLLFFVFFSLPRKP